LLEIVPLDHLDLHIGIRMSGTEVLGHSLKDSLGRGAIVSDNDAELCFRLGGGNGKRQCGGTKKYT
jgi:hypothetical protein